MLGLPKSTDIVKPLHKKAVFAKFNPNPAARNLFDGQISRMSIVAEISPQTVSISAGAKVDAVYVILVILKTADCDKNNIAMLSKLIDQNMLFVLQFKEAARLAVYRANRVLMSERKPINEWALRITGLDLDAVWENFIAVIGDIDLTGGKDLDEQIVANAEREKVLRKLERLEKQARNDKQPRRKLELAEEVKRFKLELEDTDNG